ncbi:DUF3993 domain-containing protein [Metabacillus sp. GX 13764]|uniref:DUF3993 domain-containing protein n=1 Tax=Metabacillus kandeliae TaxID=2900151 RepID=UPI001E391281|nr:DUF3993 domain-containing protein [Metabacillus kandeliae]MCD7035466.1 DUF3993 domain-containing protein [Metabacillus kandeliae]
MKKLTYLLIAGALFLMMGLPFAGNSAEADQAPLSQADASALLKKAQDAEASLTEKERSKAEMAAILTTYMTPEIAGQYIKANAVKGNNEWIVYGTDFPALAVPYFDYSQNTKIANEKDGVLVYQHFAAEDEGPVSYSGHYESVTLKKDDGAWKISSINPYSETLKQ